MKNRLDQLIEEAGKAEPPKTLPRASSKWKQYLPIIDILMGQRAHTLATAVDWLIGQGEISKDERGHAYRALVQIRLRLEAKELRKKLKESSAHPQAV